MARKTHFILLRKYLFYVNTVYEYFDIPYLKCLVLSLSAMGAARITLHRHREALVIWYRDYSDSTIYSVFRISIVENNAF